MATALYSDYVYRPLPHRNPTFHRPRTTRFAHVLFISHPKERKLSKRLLLKEKQKFKWVVRMSLVEESPPKQSIDIKKFVDFLYEDLPHLFDDQGIDRSAYDERVKFRDPITKHDTVSGYLFNIAMLKKLFRPNFQLHWVKPVRLSQFSFVYIKKINNWL